MEKWDEPDPMDLTLSQEKEGVQVTLTVKWSEGAQPQKCKVELQKVLQSWANKRSICGDFTVLNVSEDGRALIRIEPAPALTELQKLSGQTLTRKGEKGKYAKTVTIISVSLTAPEQNTQIPQIPEDASMDCPLSFMSESQDVKGQLGEQSSDMTSCTFDIPMHHYWYVNQAYKEEINRIEKESGVEIIPEVKLTFKAEKKNGSPNYAFSEFINLVQKCSAESRGFTVPLKKVNPEELKDTLKVVENKRTLSPEEVAGSLSELQELSGPTLKGKEDDGKGVTKISVSVTQPELKTQMPEDASVSLPSSFLSEPQNEQMKPLEKSSSGSSAAVSTARVETCTVPVNHFWYVDHIYKEVIRRIVKQNQVKFNAGVNVTFEADQKHGDPEKALIEFINLVQKCLGESEGSIVPLKYIDPEELKDTLKILQRKENKLLLTLSSEEMTVCGPRQSQHAISKSLNATQKTKTKTNLSAGESSWVSEDTSVNIGMSIKDPLANAGLTIEDGQWRLITTSFNKRVAQIKAKFDVDFKASDIGQGKVQVKACYKRPGGNASMESHAVRALLHLYQRISTSPMSFNQRHGATENNGLNTSNVYQQEGASSGPVEWPITHEPAPYSKPF